MSATSLVAAAIVAAICLGSLAIVPRIWKGWYGKGGARLWGARHTHGDIALFWWPFGDSTRRGAIRGLIAAICAAWCLFLSGIAAEASVHVHGESSQVSKFIAFIFLGLAGVALIMHFTVMLFNWPKFIVPPPQRDEPGALAGHGNRNSGDSRGAA